MESIKKSKDNILKARVLKRKSEINIAPKDYNETIKIIISLRRYAEIFTYDF